MAASDLPVTAMIPGRLVGASVVYLRPEGRVLSSSVRCIYIYSLCLVLLCLPILFSSSLLFPVLVCAFVCLLGRLGIYL